ncbi:MAG: YHS domain-containing protein [Candidatus Omnitrophota bacterium]|nr:YHS domain-containing protein [Candidatus Omnitrophota bacterium]
MRKIFFILITGIFIFGITNVSFAMMCGEHSGHKKIAQAQTGTQTQAEVDTQALPKETVNAGNKICPVSGEKIDEKMKSTYEYEGKIYNFCCAMCIDEFKKDPEKYIKKVGEELKTQVKEEGEITPTMHEGHQH